MGTESLETLYTLVGGEQTYANKLNQSPLAFRKLENLIPSLRGDLEQKPGNRKFASITTGALGPAAAYPYYRVETDGTITRMLLYSSRSSARKVYKLVGTSTTPVEIFPASTGFPALNQVPVFVSGANNLCYFTDNERWYVTDGTTVQLAGLDHPVDAPTFTDAAGTLDVSTNRYYWVSWATLSGEFIHWGSSSPRSLGTGALTNRAVTVTRPNHPPPRATHWMLFASRTENEGVEGALLAVVPIATTTFEDQSPFLDQAGTVMVDTVRPIRNQPMIPANFATMHKGRIFVCGFNRLPTVIRNPSFDIATGAALTGWTVFTNTANEITTSATDIKFDGAGSVRIARTAASGTGSILHLYQVVGTNGHNCPLRPGRRYRIEAAGYKVSSTGTSSITMDVAMTGTARAQSAAATLVSSADGASAWTRLKVAAEFTFDGFRASETELAIRIFSSKTGGADAIDGRIDFLRIWEVVPPSNVAYSALEEVEGLQNGRGEESFPGSTVPPFDDDASDVVNVLTYPQEASELVTMASYTDGLLVMSDNSGAAIVGQSFDDFGFVGASFFLGGMHRFGSCRNRFGAFVLTRDGKVIRHDGQEISLPIRDRLTAEMTLNTAELQKGGVYLTTYEYGTRSWLVLSYTDSGGLGVLRLFDLQTNQWFKFTDLGVVNWIVPTVYDVATGKRVLVILTSPDSSAHDLHIVDDPLAAYSGGTLLDASAATFRQSLLDLDDPGSFKVWKDVVVHTNAATLTGKFWTDPSDPDTTSGGASITLTAIDQITELYRYFLGKEADAYGKRLLLEIVLPSAATAARVFGIEVAAEKAGRYAR